MAVAAYFVIQRTVGDISIYWALLTGLVSGIVIGQATEYYTSDSKKPAREVAKASETGPATNIISGLALGMISTIIPVLAVSAAIFLSFKFGGLYGIAIAAVGMLSTLGITLATDTYGPVADNAAGIAEMAGMGAETRQRAEELDAVGNTTAAIGKGFAIGSAALTALVLLVSFGQAVNLQVVNLLESNVLIGLFIGGLLPAVFSALTMKSVGKAASQMVQEVRRQFKEIPGIMEGTGKPDYKRCVDISTAAALKEMMLPGILAVVAPIIVGWFMGPEALAGMLAGALVTGFLLAVIMANAGGAWDNAKKYIEKGNLGGKGSPSHKAAVVGDTVGDPFKDTSGPALNILIKLMTIVSLVIAPILLL
jgi:K(+)-stimulated pyrophosphate-energized sodium pump